MQIKPCQMLIPLFFTAIFSVNANGAAPKNKAACEELGGRWGRVGIYPQEFCNLPTKDANKICNDASECEGTCIAELSKDQIEKTWRGGATIYASGKCTAWKLTVGCKPVVRKGKVKGLLCQD